MKTMFKALSLTAAMLMFAACASGPPKLDKQFLMGQWDGQAMGQAVTLEYGESDITVVGMGFSIPYSLEGNQLTMDVMGNSRTSTVEVIDENQFSMVDAQSGEAAVWTRKQ